jgi:hypothetical protein
VYGDRQALNQAAYAGDAAALDQLARRYGVRYVVVDKVNGNFAVSSCLYRLLKVVVTNPSMDVLELDPGGVGAGNRYARGPCPPATAP